MRWSPLDTVLRGWFTVNKGGTVSLYWGQEMTLISGADGEAYSSVILHFIREMYGIIVSKSQTHTTASSQL